MIIYLFPKCDLPPYGTIIPCLYYDSTADRDRRWGCAGANIGRGGSFFECMGWFVRFVWHVGILGFFHWRAKRG